MRSALRPFMSGFGPAMCISSTSRFHTTCGCVAVQLHCMRNCANGNRWSTEHFFTGRRGGGFFPFRRSCFSAWMRNGDGRRITTKPMKGTAARGRTTREDRERAEWLRNDPKNRSENVMIVDLLRNDLGRLAKFGSVRAENLFAVERYPTLWQMTSTVTGELRPEVGFHEIFRALFPCGSITGAPKVRAMQLLAELEEKTEGHLHGSDRVLFAARGRCSTWLFARWNWTAIAGRWALAAAS